MKTQRFTGYELEKAAQLLRIGELVAFPTETVYGLGANAMDSAAVDKIFVAKGRPADNPLIVHLACSTDVSKVAREVPILARELMQRFWPGPLTLVLPKQKDVPNQVTAGLDTVAVRVPNHFVALELIRFAGVPIAAPSANRSGRPSATTWQAVAEDLEDRIAGIVCGPPTCLGLESTVVDMTSTPPRVLRPGGLSIEEMHSLVPGIQPYFAHPELSRESLVNSPGLKHRHYQPRASVMVIDADTLKQSDFVLKSKSRRSHYIGLKHPGNSQAFQAVLVCKNAEEYASRVFDFFRQADLLKADVVYCECVPEVGIGVALMDRLRRASHS